MNSQINTKNKKPLVFIKILLITTLAFVGYISFSQYQKILHKKSQKELSKFNNIESEIFDLHDNEGSPAGYANIDESKLSELTINELRESGAEFIYQLLLKNQLQISDLRNALQALKMDFAKYKSQEKIIKTVLVYVDFRQKFYDKKDFSKNLEGLELLVATDVFLKEKLTIIKTNLPNFSDTKKIKKDFNDSIPDLIAAQNHDPNGDFFERFRFALAKIITIRKIDETSPNIDGSIAKIEKFLDEKNYQNALDESLKLNEKSQEILKNFLVELKAATEIQKADQEILIYLNNLS